MDSQHQKWVNLSYLALASLVGYVFFTIAGKFSAVYDLETRVRNIDFILRVIAVSIGFLLFALFYRNEKINVFMNEVVEELLRVTWPTPKETSSATLMVIGMVLVSGMVLGFLDYCWSQLLKWIL